MLIGCKNAFASRVFKLIILCVYLASYACSRNINANSQPYIYEEETERYDLPIQATKSFLESLNKVAKGYLGLKNYLGKLIALSSDGTEAGEEDAINDYHPFGDHITKMHNAAYISEDPLQEDELYMFLDSEQKQVLRSALTTPSLSTHRQLQETANDIDFKSQTVDIEEKQQKDMLVQMVYNDTSPAHYMMGAEDKCRFGEKRVLEVKYWICDRKIFKKVEFEAKEDKSGCLEKEAFVEACYCPFDYYGRSCDQFLGLSCKPTEFTDYDVKCKEEFFNSSIKKLGYPACRPFIDGKYQFEMTINCTVNAFLAKESKQLILQGEGIKLAILMDPANNLEFTQPSVGVPSFKYALQNEEYRISEDFTIWSGLSFLNWNELFKPGDDLDGNTISSIASKFNSKVNLL